MLSSFFQDMRYGLRALRASPGFACVAVLSLALGIGANTAIFSLIDAVILKTLPVSHPEELLQVVSATNGYFSNPQWESLRDRQDVFSSVFAWDPSRFNLSAGGESRYAIANLGSGDYFSTLGVHTVLGRTFTPDDDRRGCPGVAVLSYDFWQREYGGNPSVLNHTISLDGHAFQILGVIQPGFTGVDIGRPLDVIVPICSEAILHGEISGRPKPSVTSRQVTARLRTLAPGIMQSTLPLDQREEDKQSYLRRTFDIRPAENGLSYLRSEYRPTLLALMAMVGVVLSIACANVANLLLARATLRQREIAIRLALGSGRGRVIRQLLTESLLLSVAGAALGALFARWGSRLLVGFLSSTGNQVVLDLSIDLRVLAFTVAVALFTGIIFGLVPAWRSAQIQPQVAMKANARGIAEGHTRFSLGKGLVMAQVAMSLLLLIGAGLLVGTFRKLGTLDPGFRPEHVLLMAVDLRAAHYPPERRAVVYRDLLQHLRAIPGVRAASSSDLTPIGNSLSRGEIVVDGFAAKSRGDAKVNFNEISSRYFESIETPLILGRDFDSRDSVQSTKVAIVNETMARKFFGNINALGKYFRVRDGAAIEPPIQIVGVVKDAKYLNLREEIPPTCFVAASQMRSPIFS
jgi:putative ABC transport system permease protein